MFVKISNPTADSAKNIVIHLIRDKKDEAKDTDDIIAIHHKGEDIYHVFYRDGNFADKTRYHMSVHTGESLDTYLLSVFRLLARDRDPFKAIQFNIPGTPTLYFLPNDLENKAIRRRLMNLMPIQRSALTAYTKH